MKKRSGCESRGRSSPQFGEMPDTMRKLGPVQLCTWLGLFCMWLYFPVAVAHNVFGADDRTRRYTRRAFNGEAIASRYIRWSASLFSFASPDWRRDSGERYAQPVSAVGALGLMSVAVIHDKYMLLLSMVGVGIAWASTLSMPYAVLAGSLPPARTGVYMGIFNFFIVTAGDPCVSVLRVDHDPFSEQQSHLRHHCRRHFPDDCRRPDAASARSANPQRAGRIVPELRETQFFVISSSSACNLCEQRM